MAAPLSYEAVLEIFLVTYNRAPSLEKTLADLANSPFASCQLTILDNHSTDRTASVAAAYLASHPTARHIRHPINIGAGPNYLRALETAQRDYVWVLCDDDTLRFTTTHHELAEHLSKKEVRLIIVGGPDAYRSGDDIFLAKAGETHGCRDLFIDHSWLVPILSFVPAVILRRDCIDSDVIHRGYMNVPNLYPHFPWIARALQNNWAVYVSKHRIVYRGALTEFPSSFVLMLGWSKSCALLEEGCLRERAILSVTFGGYRGYIVSFLEAVVSHKIRQPTSAFASGAELFLTQEGALKLLTGTLLLACLVPACVYRVLLRVFRPDKLHDLGKQFDRFRN
jgi:glycosyltransferase involved in cell wall biosynthesis